MGPLRLQLSVENLILILQFIDFLSVIFDEVVELAFISLADKPVTSC
jgi:hypothetical protein